MRARLLVCPLIAAAALRGGVSAFENGKPAGSASALTWSAGQFVRLMLDVSAGRVLDRPRYTVRRYVRRTQ